MNTEKQIKNYAVRQNNWIKANNLKKGDRVRIKKAHESYSHGWDNCWSSNNNNQYPSMDDAVGTIGTVYRVPVKHLFPGYPDAFGIQLLDGNDSKNINNCTSGGYSYPYTVLEKVQ
jgi:hypothetical protein